MIRWAKRHPLVIKIDVQIQHVNAKTRGLESEITPIFAVIAVLSGAKTMANERYLIMKAAYVAAQHGLGCGLIYVLSPPGRGKTTIRDILRKEYTKCKSVPSATEAALYEFFTKNCSDCMFIVDDKTEWIREDFANAIAYIKMIGTGKLKRLRMNKFSIEDTEIPMNCVCVLCLNPDQANSMALKIRETGFTERALKLRCAHTKTEYAKIKKMYAKYGYNRNNLPKLKTPKGFFKPVKQYGQIDDETEEWIADAFQTEAADTVRLIAKVITKEAFDKLKPCLLSGVTETEFMEETEFDV